MADVITRLKLDSGEYDNKIKRAVSGLMQMEAECRKVGGTLAVLEKDQLDYVKSLGNMETVSRTARGRISELSNAYVELAVQYRRLTDEEKKGDYGRALNSSLTQLRGRLNDAKNELADVDKELKNTSSDGGNLSSVLDSVAGKFGLNTSMLKNFSGTLGAAVVAVKVAKDAFFNSEEGIDEWGRTVEASQTIYEAFLYSLNNGDVNGFLSKIGQIQQAAVEAYNALDLLGTQKSIQAPQLSGKQAEISRFETMLRTGRFIEAADGRKSSMKTGDVLSQSQKDRIAKQLESAMGEVATITKSQVKTATTAIDKLYAEQATTLGISKKEFMDATKNWDSFTDALAKSDQYWKWRNEHTTYSSPTTNASPNATSIATATMQREIYDDSKNPYRGYGWVKSFKDDGEMWKRLTEEIAKRDAAQSQLYGQYGRMYRQVNRVEGVKPYGGGGGGGTRSGGGTAWAPIGMADLTLGTQKVQKVVEVTVDDAAALEQIREIEGVTIADKGMTITATDEALPKLREIEGVKLSDKVIDVVVNDNSDFLFGRSKQDVQKDLQRAQKADYIAPDEWTRAEARKDVTRYQKELEKMNGEGDVTKGGFADAYTHDFGKDMDALAKELKNEQKTTQLSETEQVEQMGAMVGGIQQMVGGIAQLGIEIPEGFQSMLGGLQGIMTILQAIQTIQTVGSVLGLFRNGGLIGKAAGGMLIPGNSYSGDHLRMPVDGGAGWIGVNSGELILNRAQQNSIAGQLTVAERGGGGYQGTPYVDGEKIYLGMNNFLRRSGRGEIVTSRR